MKYKIGNKVKFLYDTGGGVISNITREGKIFVRIEEGFDVPVVPSELMLDEKEEVADNNKANEEIPVDMGEDEEDDNFSENIVPGQEKQEEAQEDRGEEVYVYLGIVPDKNTGDSVDIFLINDCNYRILFFTGYKLSGQNCKYIRSGLLEENTKMLLTSTTEKELKNFPEIVVQLVFYKKDEFFYHNPAFSIINLKFMESVAGKMYVDNDFFEEKANIIPVMLSDGTNALTGIPREEIASAVLQKEMPVSEKKQAAKQVKHPVKEVDLHIHELVDNEAGLSHKDMLDIQKEKFRHELEDAINKQVKKIVFIHGKGNGRLKYEIRHALDRDYPKLKYQDASFSEYGFGATMVMLY